MHHRISRILGALGLAIALTGGTLAGITIASPAPLLVGGSNLSPTVVSQSSLGAFTVTATNPESNTSNIAQLYLTEMSGASVYAVDTTQGVCTTTGQLKCDFGQLRVGQVVTVTVALTAPSSGSAWNVDFEFSTTGYVTDQKGKNQSHGDSWSVPFTITLARADSDQAGTYVVDTHQQTIHNGLSLGNNNKQSTQITVFDTLFPASLADHLPTACITGSTICPSSFFGEASQLDVDGGANHLIHVVIVMYRPGVNPNQVHGIYHTWADGTLEENIGTVCPTSGTPTTECFTATKVGQHNLQLDIWLFHNGRVMGW
jgi:hypothetical protein